MCKSLTGVSLQADSCYIAEARSAQKTQFYCCVAQTTQKISHVIAEYFWCVTSLHLCGSVFTEPVPRSGLHNPVVLLLVRILLRNGCVCGSTVLAWGNTPQYFTAKNICFLVVNLTKV
jgi:hypothetical protein